LALKGLNLTYDMHVDVGRGLIKKILRLFGNINLRVFYAGPASKKKRR